MIMKRVISILMAFSLMLALASCGGNSTADTAEAPATAETQSSQEASGEDNPEEASVQSDEPTEEAGDIAETSEVLPDESEAEIPQPEKDVLVVYFSATGTTKGVAETIATIIDADVYEITAAQEYTSEDLDWNDSDSRTTHEQNDSTARPEISSETLSLDGYSTVYIGYPIWWGEAPRIMNTFVESYDFDGITIIPFCTSGSSGIGSSGQTLESLAGSGNWLDGQRFGAGASEDEIASWIAGLQ